MSQYASLLGAVTIDASNNAIRMNEGGVLATVSIAAGVYYIRGDGAADDLGTQIRLALNAHPNTTLPNTYVVDTITVADAYHVSTIIKVSLASGTSSFQLLFADALTTFDASLIGFAALNTALDAATKTSTLSTPARWISNDVVESLEPGAEYDVSVMRARSGRVRGVRRGGPYDLRRLVLRYQDSRRVLATDNVADPNASFARFLQRHGDGTRFEFHSCLGTLYSPDTRTFLVLSSSTRVGLAWIFDEPTSSMFAPDRVEPGLALYDWDLGLLGWVS